jgi:hypothetical protein
VFWNDTPLTVRKQEVDPTDSVARITFHVDIGNYTYDNDPSSQGSGQFLNPTTTNTGQFLIRATQVSGDAIAGDTLATWLDIHANGPLYEWEWTLTRSGRGVATAEVDIDIADDTGGGTPGTIVTKRVTFISEVIGSDLTWSELQHDLVDEKTNLDALCRINFRIDGVAKGEADTSGAFTENWASAPQPTYTVQVDLISGDAPTSGPALATPHTLDQFRTWQLQTSAEEVLTCELDVTIDDQIGGVVTKRITMTSDRNDTTNDLVWDTTPAALIDTQLEQTARVRLIHDSSGFMDGTTTAGQIAPFPIAWHQDSPSTNDAQIYEYKVDALQVTNGAPVGVWINCQFANTFEWLVEYPFVSPSTQQIVINENVIVTYRRVGQPSTEISKLITVEASVYKGSFP